MEELELFNEQMQESEQSKNTSLPCPSEGEGMDASSADATKGQ